MIKSKCLYDQVKLVWVPVHQGIRGNEKADKCAVRGLSLEKATACNDVLTSLVVVANKTD